MVHEIHSDSVNPAWNNKYSETGTQRGLYQFYEFSNFIKKNSFKNFVQFGLLLIQWCMKILYFPVVWYISDGKSLFY